MRGSAVEWRRVRGSDVREAYPYPMKSTRQQLALSTLLNCDQTSSDVGLIRLGWDEGSHGTKASRTGLRARVHHVLLATGLTGPLEMQTLQEIRGAPSAWLGVSTHLEGWADGLRCRPCCAHLWRVATVRYLP